jgi:hypothetical protein
LETIPLRDSRPSPPMQLPRRGLNADDLYALTQAQRAADQPRETCAALEALSAEVIGHRLFTVMRFDHARSEVQRVYSNLPATCPPGGRKQKKATAGPITCCATSRCSSALGPTRPIVDKLNAEISRILFLPEVKQKMAEIGVEVAKLTPPELGDLTRKDAEKWGRTIKELGITPQ